MNRSTAAFWTWLAIAALSIIPIAFFFASMADPEFMSGAMGDWFGTMIGVLIGIPIALWVSRWQEKQQTRREEAARQREALDRKTRLLTLVRQELEHNRHQLTLILGPVESVYLYSHGGLKDELWSALSSGGELQWIRDLHLLDTLALAYHHVRRLIFFERLMIQSLDAPGGSTFPPLVDRPDYLIFRELAKANVMEDVERALEEIDKTLAG